MNLQLNLNNLNLVNLALAQNITTTLTPTTEPALSRVSYPTLPMASQTIKSESIPDRSKFKGNRTMLQMFVAQLRLKILVNGDLFPSEAHQRL